MATLLTAIAEAGFTRLYTPAKEYFFIHEVTGAEIQMFAESDADLERITVDRLTLGAGAYLRLDATKLQKDVTHHMGQFIVIDQGCITFNRTESSTIDHLVLETAELNQCHGQAQTIHLIHADAHCINLNIPARKEPVRDVVLHDLSPEMD